MPDPVVEEFARAHPGEVARLLGNHSASELIEFLTTVRSETAARIMGRLNSQLLAAVMGAMPADQIGKILGHSSHEDSLTLIAHLPNARYSEIIEASGHNSDVSSRLYSFTEQTLGALAGPDFIAIRSGRLVADARAELSATQHLDVPIFIISETGTLLGRLPALALIPGTHDRVEVDRMMVEAYPLPDRMTLASSLEARQWQNATVLPVVNSADQLLGTISRVEVERLVADTERGHRPSLDAITSAVTTGYFSVCSELLNLVFGRHQDHHQP